MRTIENTSTLFTPLENAIHQQFIPALTGREPCSQEERELLSLPACLGGLNITDPTAIAKKAILKLANHQRATDTNDHQSDRHSHHASTTTNQVTALSSNS